MFASNGMLDDVNRGVCRPIDKVIAHKLTRSVEVPL
jgi:hypothetical protein